MAHNLWVVNVAFMAEEDSIFVCFSFILFHSLISPRRTFLEDDDGLGNGSDDPQAVVSRFVPIYGLE